MSLVQIGPEREHNGYDDSDFYVPVLDTDTGIVSDHLVGTTRGGGGIRYDGLLEPRKLSDVERAAFEGAAWGHAIKMAEAREIARVMHPGPYMSEWVPAEGTRVMLKDPVRNRNKVETECQKCVGSGKWANPKNPSDVRPCFGCSGSGHRLGFSKGAGMRTIPAGTIGTVISSGERRSQYGTWSYGAGARIRTDDGQVFNANTRALRLAEEPDLKRAKADAKARFQAMTTWRCYITHRSAA